MPKPRIRTARKKTHPKVPAGFKVVAPPKKPALRRLLAGEDLRASGGARTVHHVPAR